MQLFGYFYVRGIVGGLIDLEPFLLYILFGSSTLVVQYKLVIIVEDIQNSKSNNIYSMNKKKCIIDKYNTVYGFDLFVIVNPDKSVIDKKFSFRHDDTSIIDDEWSSYTAYTVNGAYDKEANKDCEIIVINKLKEPDYNINTFAHESFHAAFDVLSTCDIKLTEDTNEVFAYLIGYFTECINKTAKKA